MHEKSRGHAPWKLAEGQPIVDTPRHRWGRHHHPCHAWLQVRLGGNFFQNEVRRELQASNLVHTALRQVRWMITTLEHITSFDFGGGQNRAISTAPHILNDTMGSRGKGRTPPENPFPITISTTQMSPEAALTDLVGSIFPDFSLMHGAPLRMSQCQMDNLVVGERLFLQPP